MRLFQAIKQFELAKVLEFASSSATVELAAQVLCVEPARTAKTLPFRNFGGCILLVTAEYVRIKHLKYKVQLGVKQKHLTPEEVLKYIAHAVGGVCPLQLDDRMRTVFLIACYCSLQRCFQLVAAQTLPLG